MSNLTRFEPLDNMFPEMFRRMMRPMQWAGETLGDIRIDLTENDNAYEVRAEIPGAKKDDIRVAIDGNYVSISAEVRKEREEDKKTKQGRSLIKELYSGSVSRGFTLAHEVDNKTAVAKLEDGVLKLTLPKRSGAGSKLLNIE